MSDISFSIGKKNFSIHLDHSNFSMSLPWFRSMFGEKAVPAVSMESNQLSGFEDRFEPGVWLGRLVTEVSAYLCQSGFFPFHGALVQFGDRVVVLTGKSGAGKSLWTIALSQLGGRILCDDLFWLRATDEVMQTISIPKPVATRSPIYFGAVFPAEQSVERSWDWKDTELVKPHADTKNRLNLLSDVGPLALDLLRENSFHLRNYDLKDAYNHIRSRVLLTRYARSWDLAYCDSETTSFLRFAKEVRESLIALR